MIKSMMTAFSIFSRIPVPHFEWKEEDMRYTLCFLPLIGAVTGLIMYGSLYLIDVLALPLMARVCIVSLIPLIVTGGFHMDGYMDVKDAQNSFGSVEEKLRILKDPHIGAFAVISFAGFSMIWLGSLSVIFDRGLKSYIPLAGVFVLSRCGCAISSLVLKKAKDEGMLNKETLRAGKREILILSIELTAALLVAAICDAYAAAALGTVLLLFFIFYRHKTYTEFGGVTGDTAGYFVCAGELVMIFTLALYSLTGL